MDGLDLPHPTRTVLAFAALAAAALALDADPRLPWAAGAAAAALFSAAGGVRAVRQRRDLAAVRRAADKLIIEHPSSHPTSELIRWRSAELTSRDARDLLRRDVASVIRDLDPRKLPSASPLHRPAARLCIDDLERLRDRLGADRPVCARGILLVRLLLHDAASPLYCEGAEVLLARELRRVLGALEP